MRKNVLLAEIGSAFFPGFWKHILSFLDVIAGPRARQAGVVPRAHRFWVLWIFWAAQLQYCAPQVGVSAEKLLKKTTPQVLKSPAAGPTYEKRSYFIFESFPWNRTPQITHNRLLLVFGKWEDTAIIFWKNWVLLMNFTLCICISLRHLWLFRYKSRNREWNRSGIYCQI